MPAHSGAARREAETPLVLVLGGTSSSSGHDWAEVGRRLERRSVPVVVVGRGGEAQEGERTRERFIEIGRLRVDLVARAVRVDERQIELPPKEFRILAELASRQGQPISTSELLTKVWSDAPGITSRDVYWHIWRLRKLIAKLDGARIVNRRGYGYVLTSD